MKRKKWTKLAAILMVLTMAVTMTSAQPAFAGVIADGSDADTVLQILDRNLEDIEYGNVSARQVMNEIQGVIQDKEKLESLEKECAKAEEAEKGYREAVGDFESALSGLIEQMKLAEGSSSGGMTALSSSTETFTLEEYETYRAELKNALEGLFNGVSGYDLWDVVEKGRPMAGDSMEAVEDAYSKYNTTRKGFYEALDNLKAVIKAEAAMENSVNDEPYIESDSTMDSGQKVTYTSVWFGSYPQLEIVDTPAICGVYRYWKDDDSYKVNKRIYKKLQKATGWDENGDITIEGVKYRRIKQSDTLTTTNDSYNWNSTYGASPEKYHYFRYMPIKWRILDRAVQFPHDRILLIADKLLDGQQYNAQNKSVTWDRSTLRSWLNGLGSGNNDCGIDYANRNFIDTAFTEEEQNRIYTTDLTTPTTGSRSYSSESGEVNTQDKVFLLTEFDVRGWNDLTYGFASEGGYDEAVCREGATYARAMGAYCSNVSSFDDIETGDWWVRSPGQYSNYVGCVLASGSFDSKDLGVVDNVLGICPSITVAGSDEPYLTPAGTVCTNGTVKEKNTTIVQETQSGKVTVKTKKVKYAKLAKADQKTAPLIAKGLIGTVKYEVAGGAAAAKKALKIDSKTGKVTVKKKTKAGTYKIKVKVTASGDKYYEKAVFTKNVTVKVVK